jgi:hypothetical protein
MRLLDANSLFLGLFPLLALWFFLLARLERSRGGVFGKPRRESMIWTNHFRMISSQPRVAQPHRYAP